MFRNYPSDQISTKDMVKSKRDARCTKKRVGGLEDCRNSSNMLDVWNKLSIKFFKSVLNLADRINLRHFRLQDSMFLYT